MMSFRRNKKSFTIIFFLLPSLFGLIFFSLTPMVSSFFISLTDWDVISGSPKFLGFSNFINILQGEEFWRTLKNTLYFIVLYIPLMLLVSLSVANLFNSKYKGITMYRAIYYIPVITSWVAGALIWKWVLNPQYGAINTILGYIGIRGTRLAI